MMSRRYLHVYVALIDSNNLSPPLPCLVETTDSGRWHIGGHHNKITERQVGDQKIGGRAKSFLLVHQIHY